MEKVDSNGLVAAFARTTQVFTTAFSFRSVLCKSSSRPLRASHRSQTRSRGSSCPAIEVAAGGNPAAAGPRRAHGACSTEPGRSRSHGRSTIPSEWSITVEARPPPRSASSSFSFDRSDDYTRARQPARPGRLAQRAFALSALRPYFFAPVVSRADVAERLVDRAALQPVRRQTPGLVEREPRCRVLAR